MNRPNFSNEFNIFYRKLKPTQGRYMYAASASSVQQVSLNQCSHYTICTTCMRDPYCGWNIRQNVCEYAETSVNLVALNENLCSRFHKQESVKSVAAEQGGSQKLECRVTDEYLLEFVEWTKDDSALVFTDNIFLSESKG